MNEDLYYFLLKNKYLTHGIGEISDQETYFKFDSILKNGGLMSLEKLRQIGINVVGKVPSDGFRNISESQISLFDPTTPEIKKRLLSKNCNYFLPFSSDVIFFIIDRQNLNLEKHPEIPFEIKSNNELIPTENFKGIIAPTECSELLDDIQKKYGICLPIYDFDFNQKNNLDDNQKSI